MTDNSGANLAPVWNRAWELFADRAEGSYIWDVNGNKYLDFTSGIGVTNTGHCHPRIVEAAQQQVARLIHGQANIVYHEPMRRLVDALQDVVPAGLDTFFFANSGAEAVEASIKLARAATGRANIIAFERSFHGRTIGTMALTSSKVVYRGGYQPLMAGVFFAPYAYCYRCPKAEAASDHYDYDRCCNWPLAQIRHMLKSQSAPEETAAILVEPILGEGGYVVPPPEFLQGLREICDEYDILLIVDEVQTGFGRTGRFFAVEHFDVVPDILIMAKGLASGFPLSGIAAPTSLMSKWKPGTHGGTYGGNAVACAAAEATIQVIQEEDLVENAHVLGKRLRQRLSSLQQTFTHIGDVRGLGLMVATEFVTPGTREPNASLATAVQQYCFDENLLLLTCGTDSNIVRWIPPLTITTSELDYAIGVFEAALDRTIG